MRRYLSADELARLGIAMSEAERAGTETTSALAAIRLLILTGARVSEILTARWEYLDEARGCLSLPHSKTGAKDVYLGPAALQVLRRIREDTALRQREETERRRKQQGEKDCGGNSGDRVGNVPWIIPGADFERPLVNLTKPWFRIRRAAHLTDVRLHDLRHSFASVGVAGGLTLPILGALLGHTQAATTARYAHLAADPLRQAAELIGSRIAAAMQDPDGLTNEVVPISSARQ
jgi:integrase